MEQIVLVRHASATGQEPSALLTAEGERQAQLLADLLDQFHIARVISSPFTRAMDSVAPFCRRANLELEADDRLVERTLSAHNHSDWRDHLRRSFDELDYCLEGGESSRTAQARGTAAMRAALASGKRCALVTHGNLLALILKSVDATIGYDAWAALSNPDAFVVHVENEQPTGFTRVWARAPDPTTTT